MTSVCIDTLPRAVLRLRGVQKSRFDIKAIESFTSATVAAALTASGNNVSMATTKLAGSVGFRLAVGMAIVNDRAIAQLNREYRGKRGPTDILSFASTKFGTPGLLHTAKPSFDDDFVISEDGAKELDLGDMFICVTPIQKLADELRCPVDLKLKEVIVHGVVHLLGNDHELGEQERERFEGLEAAVMEDLNKGFLKDAAARGDDVTLLR